MLWVLVVIISSHICNPKAWFKNSVKKLRFDLLCRQGAVYMWKVVHGSYKPPHLSHNLQGNQVIILPNGAARYLMICCGVFILSASYHYWLISWIGVLLLQFFLQPRIYVVMRFFGILLFIRLNVCYIKESLNRKYCNRLAFLFALIKKKIPKVMTGIFKILILLCTCDWCIIICCMFTVYLFIIY